MKPKLLLVATAGALLFAGCDDRQITRVEVDRISIDETIRLTKGEVAPVNLWIFPEQAADRQIYYKIENDPDYIQVIDFDLRARQIVALAEGEARLYVTAGGKVDTCMVYVIPFEPDILPGIPDPVLRQTVIDYFDANGNGHVTEGEANAWLPEFNLDYARIGSLEGLELLYLTRLTLTSCGKPELDLSHLPYLDELIVETPDIEGLRVISPTMTYVDFNSGGPIAGVDFSGCPALGTISITNYPEKELDLSNHPWIRRLFLGNINTTGWPYNLGPGRLTSVDLSGLSLLTELSIDRLPGFGSLELPDHPSLTRVRLEILPGLKTIDLSGCRQLTEIAIRTSLLDSGEYDMRLDLFDVSNCGLEGIDISYLSEIKELRVEGNPGMNGSFLIQSLMGENEVPDGFPTEGWEYYGQPVRLRYFKLDSPTWVW